MSGNTCLDCGACSACYCANCAKWLRQRIADLQAEVEATEDARIELANRLYELQQKYEQETKG